jgi:hypothetical protein
MGEHREATAEGEDERLERLEAEIHHHLVATNGSCRDYRVRKECAPRDPELRASCVGSFGVYEPR